MRCLSAFVAACSISAIGASAEPLGVGGLRVGMTLDEVKAAAPQATWSETGKREISAKRVVAFGAETFDVTYKVEPWGRTLMRLSFDEADRAAPSDGCEARFMALAKAVEAQFGALEAAVIAGRFGSPTAAGEKSTVQLARDSADPNLFEADSRILNVAGGIRLAGDNRSKGRCRVAIDLRGAPARPPQGTIAGADLIFLAQPSISVRYHSLDSLPPVPAEGVVVPVTCTVMSQLKLAACQAGDLPTEVATYRTAAVVQAGYMTVEDQTRDGRWTEGERVQIDVRLKPRETIAVLTPVAPTPAVAAAKPAKPVREPDPRAAKRVPTMTPPPGPADPSGLVFTGDPRGMDLARVFPPAAMRADVVGFVDMSCIVQADYSVICPERKATTNENNDFAAAFERAAGQIAMLFRVRETTVDGQSAAGKGFRRRVRFVLE